MSAETTDRTSLSVRIRISLVDHPELYKALAPLRPLKRAERLRTLATASVLAAKEMQGVSPQHIATPTMGPRGAGPEATAPPDDELPAALDGAALEHLGFTS